MKKILDLTKAIVKIGGAELKPLTVESIEIRHNACRWCEQPTDIRCKSCHTKACVKCLNEHLEVKLVPKESWPKMQEKIPSEN